MKRSSKEDLATRLSRLLAVYLPSLAGGGAQSKPPSETPPVCRELWSSLEGDVGVLAACRGFVGLSEASRVEPLAAVLRPFLSQRPKLATSLEASLRRDADSPIGSASKAGSRASAKGKGARAAVDSSLAAGDIEHSNINVRGIQIVYNVYRDAKAQGKPKLDSKAFERVLRDYLKWVQDSTSQVRLYGTDVGIARGVPQRTLESIMVPLRLGRAPAFDRLAERKWRDDEGEPDARRKYLELMKEARQKAEPVDLAGLMTVSARLAVVGGAGSGKSTLLKYIAWYLARAFSAEPRSPTPIELKFPAKCNFLVPLLVPFRSHRSYLEECDKARGRAIDDPLHRKLSGFISYYLRRRSERLGASQDFFHRLLTGGGCLLLLDGLDEVVDSSDRANVREQVEELIQTTYPGNRVIVTAREAGYRGDSVFGEPFECLDVKPLEDDGIAGIIRHWCATLYGGEAEARGHKLEAAVVAINTSRRAEGLEPLISSPLVTSMVVSVDYNNDDLPRERAALYDKCVDVLLKAPYSPSDPSDPHGSALSRVDDLSRKEWLAALALAMHQGGHDGAAVSEERLKTLLEGCGAVRDLDGGKVTMGLLIEEARLRGGLLEERGELFEFVHLTFQEYLAAWALAKRRERAFAVLDGKAADPWWREVHLLTYGAARRDSAREFARELLRRLSRPDQKPAERLAGLELSASALLEIEKPDVAALAAKASELLDGLRQADFDVPAILRARAGDTLGRLGDPRFRRELFGLPADEYLGFVEIPGGTFWMGSDPKRDALAFEDEQPRHEVTLPRFFLARYPVTVAQLQAFVEATGFKPEDLDCWQEPATRPVRYVSFREALAYCQWLDGVLRTDPRVPPKLREILQGPADGNQRFTVILPSEAEWERAARRLDERLYAWGNEWDPKSGNVAGSGIGTTSAVGSFEHHKDDEKYCADLTGNTWEWTRSTDKPYPYDPTGDARPPDTRGDERRVSRGGAFDYEPVHARCACRSRDLPEERYGVLGFRLALSPFFSDASGL